MGLVLAMEMLARQGFMRLWIIRGRMVYDYETLDFSLKKENNIKVQTIICKKFVVFTCFLANYFHVQLYTRTHTHSPTHRHTHILMLTPVFGGHWVEELRKFGNTKQYKPNTYIHIYIYNF